MYALYTLWNNLIVCVVVFFFHFHEIFHQFPNNNCGYCKMATTVLPRLPGLENCRPGRGPRWPIFSLHQDRFQGFLFIEIGTRNARIKVTKYLPTYNTKQEAVCVCCLLFLLKPVIFSHLPLKNKARGFIWNNSF